uniref:Uncharacterized protein n=1 Tax=Anguilla anguilla TaxID=7936 RepID=A0A0E9R746_ANGAN
MVSKIRVRKLTERRQNTYKFDFCCSFPPMEDLI